MFSKLIRTFVFVGLAVQVLIGQSLHGPDDNGKNRACFTRFFQPAWIPMPSSEGISIGRCTEPSLAMCDLSKGIAEQNYSGVRCLIDANYNFNVEGGRYPAEYMPLFQAALHDPEMLKLLLGGKFPLDLEARDDSGRTALSTLAAMIKGIGHPRRDFSWDKVYASMELLLKNGADVNSFYNGTTPLISEAGFSGQTRFVQLLLTYHADIDRQSVNGQTALMTASDDPETLEVIFKANPNLYLRDNLGRNAFIYSVQDCEVHKAKALLERDPALLASADNKGLRAEDFLASDVKQGGCTELRDLIASYQIQR